AKDGTREVESKCKPFVTLILLDANEEIDTKLGDASKEDESVNTPENIVKLTGEVNQFRGKAQLKIFSIRPAQTTDGVQVSDFVEKAPVDKEYLAQQLTEAIFEMQNPTMQRIVRAFIKKYQNA